MARIAKVYDYELVVQQKWGSKWEDVVGHETDSMYLKNFKEAKSDLLAYQAAPVRIIGRRTLKTQTT